MSGDESLDELAVNLSDWRCQGPLDWQYDPKQCLYLAFLGGGLLPIDKTIFADFKAGTVGISVLFMSLAAVTLVATLFAREMSHEPA